MAKLTQLQKIYWFLFGLLFPFFLTIPVISYLIFLYSFTDMSELSSKYPIWEKDPLTNTLKIKFVGKKPSNYASLSEMAQAIQHSVIISEDGKFYQHYGIDMDSLYEVLKNFIESGGQTKLRGASTISQQVVKNIYFDNERSYWRKLKELLLTIKMERTLGKKRILELYLNIAEWGKNIYGAKSASLTYFKKMPSEINYKEGAFLAMLLPNPVVYSTSFYNKSTTRYARSRIRQIINQLLLAHFIDDFTHKNALYTPLPWEGPIVIPPTPSEEEEVIVPDEEQEVIQEEISAETKVETEIQPIENVTDDEYNSIKYQQ